MPTSPSRVDAARAELCAVAARGQGGRAAMRRFSDCVDDLLQRLFTDAPAAAEASLIVALGGYGRRQLCRHSDVDVLLLFDGPIGAAEEGRVRSILHPLWDLRFSVGHQIRQINDFAELEIDNPEFLLALIDARAVAGDVTLLDRIAARLGTAAARALILDALQRLVYARHAGVHDTFYQLETDLK